MSYQKTKIVLRIPIPELDNTNVRAALEYFRARIPQQPSIDGDEETIEFFEFPNSGYEVKHSNNKWYIDFLFSGLGSYQLGKLQDIAETQISRLRIKGVTPDDVNLVAIQWYTGGEESFVFKRELKSWIGNPKQNTTD